jgi:hypothetical protein
MAGPLSPPLAQHFARLVAVASETMLLQDRQHLFMKEGSGGQVFRRWWILCQHATGYHAHQQTTEQCREQSTVHFFNQPFNHRIQIPRGYTAS